MSWVTAVPGRFRTVHGMSRSRLFRSAAGVLPVSLLAAAGLPSAVSLLGSAASSSQVAWVASLASSLRPQLAMGSLVSAASLALLRRPIPALGSLLAAAVAAAPLMSAAQANSSALSIDSLFPENGGVLVRFHNVFDRNPDLLSALRPAFLADASGEVPELVAFFETPPSSRAAFETLDSELGSGWRRVYSRLVSSGAGLVLYSRLPAVSVEVKHLELPSSRPAADVTLTRGDERLRLIFAHPVSPRSRRLHASQTEDLSALAEAVASSELPAVLFGDLNVTVHSTLWESFRAAGLVSATGTRRTWSYAPGSLFAQAVALGIDHVVFDPRRVVVSRPELGDLSGSDHHPVTVRAASR